MWILSVEHSYSGVSIHWSRVIPNSNVVACWSYTKDCDMRRHHRQITQNSSLANASGIFSNQAKTKKPKKQNKQKKQKKEKRIKTNANNPNSRSSVKCRQIDCKIRYFGRISKLIHCAILPGYKGHFPCTCALTRMKADQWVLSLWSITSPRQACRTLTNRSISFIDFFSPTFYNLFYGAIFDSHFIMTMHMRHHTVLLL